MANSRLSQNASAPAPLTVAVAQPAMFMMPCAFMLVPFPGAFPAQIQFASAAPAAPPPAAAPAPPAQPDAPASELKTEAAAPAAPPAPVRPPVGAGLPAPLVAMLRDAEGPFLANEVFSVTPPQPLGSIEEEVEAPEWYAITRGHFVGVVDQYALSAVAISGVAHGARKAYTTQHLALAAFNQALTWGGVQVA
ncbi:hypothetical protein B0H16DRAFT_1717161 [Mycena metata]|uniref:Uncharacterized protein n=1 Tax=Mycena metata TaxID=1033252 RepID=A0AAD7NM04_9AGAR|nr:hypothetical protein B0H16DRAFT_1717161 [Mycena metata]